MRLWADSVKSWRFFHYSLLRPNSLFNSSHDYGHLNCFPEQGCQTVCCYCNTTFKIVQSLKSIEHIVWNPHPVLLRKYIPGCCSLWGIVCFILALISRWYKTNSSIWSPHSSCLITGLSNLWPTGQMRPIGQYCVRVLCGPQSHIHFSWISELMKPESTVLQSSAQLSTLVANMMGLIFKILWKIYKTPPILFLVARLKTWLTGARPAVDSSWKSLPY